MQLPRKSLPNLLTFFRIASVFAFLLLMELAGGKPEGWFQRVAVFLFIAAALSDWADGVLARRFQAISSLGKLLDPVADKILVFSALILSAQYGWIEGWIVVLLLLREFLVLFLRLNALQEGKLLVPDWGGKGKTILQLVAIPFLLWQTPLWGLIPTGMVGRILLYTSLFISLGSGIRYFVLYFRRGTSSPS